MGLMDEVDKITSKMAFLNPDSNLSVESIEYWPHGKSPISINASVTRQPSELMQKWGIVTHKIVVWVSTDDVPTVNSPGDKVKIALDFGGKVDRHPVSQILESDFSGFTLLIG